MASSSRAGVKAAGISEPAVPSCRGLPSATLLGAVWPSRAAGGTSPAVPASPERGASHFLASTPPRRDLPRK